MGVGLESEVPVEELRETDGSVRRLARDAKLLRALPLPAEDGLRQAPLHRAQQLHVPHHHPPKLPGHRQRPLPEGYLGQHVVQVRAGLVRP